MSSKPLGTPTEIWKPVPGYGNHYEASSQGRLRSKARIVRKPSASGTIMLQHYPARVLNGSADARGYLRAHISVDGIKFGVAVHRMIAFAFHGQPKPGQECCHNNGNPSDNRPENLRWDTHLENNRDRKRHGNYAVGRDHHMAKFDSAFLERIMRGEIGYRDALREGISATHFYRVKRAGRHADR